MRKKREADFFSHLFEAIPEPTIVAEAHTGRLVALNTAAERLLRRPRQSLIGQPQSVLHPPELKEEIRESFSLSASRRSDTAHGVFVQDGEGQWIPVHIQSQTFSFQGKTYIIGLFRDLRGSPEEEVALYREMLEASLSATYLMQDFRFVYANPRLATLVGRTLPELLAISPLELIYEPDREQVVSNLEALLRGEKNRLEHLYRLRHRDGTLVHVACTSRLIVYQGRPAVLGTAVEISGLIQAQEAYQHSEARYQRLFEESPVALYRSTPEGRFLAVNRAFARLFGYATPEEVTGINAEALYLKPQERRRFLEALTREGILRNHVAAYRHRSGRTLHTIENAILVTEPDGTQVIEGAIVDLSNEFELKRRFESLHAHTQDAIFWIRVLPDGRFMVESTNPAHQQKTGLTPEMLWNRPLEEVLPPEIVEHVSRNYRSCLQAGGPIEYEEVLSLPAGQRTWLTQLVPLPDEEGKVDLIAGIARDITQIRIQERLQQRENAFFEGLIREEKPLSALLEGLCLAIEEAIPGSRASILLLEGDRLRHGAAPHLPEAYNALIDGLPIGPRVGSCGTAAYTGQPVWVADTAQDPRWEAYRDLARQYHLRACWSVPFKNASGRVLGTFAVYFDHIRGPQPREKEVLKRLAYLAGLAVEYHTIQQDRDRLARALQQVTQGVLITDVQRKIIWVNEAWERTTGYTLVEAQGKKPGALLQGRDTNPDTIERLRAALNALEPVDVRIYNYRKDKTGYWAHVHIDPLYDASGRHVGYIGLHEDVTALVEAERALERARDAAEEANRLKSTFLANMSHEIRTPLNGILGFADLLADELAERGLQELMDHVETIRSSGERLLRLLNDLLDLSRIEAGRIELRMQRVWLGELAQQVVRLLSPMAQKKGLKLELHATEHFPVEADPDRLHQVLVNLLSNAIKFTDAGSVTVEVGTRRQEGRLWTCVRVVDTGRGIAPEFLPHLFEPFRQESSGYRRTHEGAGLGLAITKRLVELMQGRICVQSEKGRGSTFEVLFPALEVEGLGSAVSSKRAHPRHILYLRSLRPRVLLIEDHPESASWLQITLKPIAEEVAVAPDGSDALRLITESEKPFDVILLDVHLPPPWDGFGLLEEIRSRYPAYREVPVVVESAYVDGEVRRRAEELGVAGFLSKPLEKYQLMQVLAEALGFREHDPDLSRA